LYIFLDYDGTLVKTKEEDFTTMYFSKLANKMNGDPDHVAKLIMGIVMDIARSSDGTKTIYEQFLELLESRTYKSRDFWISFFTDFYMGEFAELGRFVTPNRELIDFVRNKNAKLVYASNSVFPRIAVEQRMKFIGMDWNEFEYVVHMENSHYVKPDPRFFEEIILKLGTLPENCVMIGDSEVDKACEKIGVRFVHVKEKEKWMKL